MLPGRGDQQVVDIHVAEGVLTDIKLGEFKGNIVSVERIGKKEVGRTRPIRVDMGSFLTRDKVLRNASLLKDSESHRRISIARDLTREERELEKAKYLSRKAKFGRLAEERDAAATAAAATATAIGGRVGEGATNRVHPTGRDLQDSP